MVEKKEINEEEEIQHLKAQLAKKEMEFNKRTFLDTASLRIDNLELVVEQNRMHLIRLNEKYVELQQNFVELIKKK